ncbi:MAG: TRAP transporter TatT component family protein [Acidobacteriota bacterium]
MARATGRGIGIGVAACLLLSGCAAVRRAAIHSVARSLAGGGEAWASDDDPQLVRDATPFALKTIESLLAEDPRDPDLLRAAARGFTEYAYAFVDTDARELEIRDYAAAQAERERARRLYLRGRDYGLRGLEVSHPGIAAALQRHPTQAVAACGRADVALLYWSGAAWGGAVSVGKDHPELLADLPAVRALLERALALDEGFEHGAIHAALLPLDALSPAMGGSPERAARHYERALALSGGKDAGIYVTWAESVAVARQDRKGFDAALASALAIDPDAQPATRLANLVAQRRARALKAREDELFLEEATP